MKVLHVISSVSPRFGGPSRATADIETALAARGIDVTTATTDQDGPGDRLDVRCGEAVATPHAIRWHFPVDIDFYTVSFGLGRWLMSNIRRYDVVHVHGLFSFAPGCAAWLARAAGVPYVVRPFGVLLPYGMTQRRPALKQLSFALLERRLLKGAAAVHFTSRFERDEAAALGLTCNGVVIPLGIEVEPLAARPERAADAPFGLLFIGRIDPIKNLEGLIAALGLVSDAGANVRLRIAGEGDADYAASLKALAERLGVAGRIDWLGQVAGEGKRRLLQAASAFVLPSHSESFGIAAVEALAAGLPCIVSRSVAVAADIAEAEAGLVTATDAESIAAGIRGLTARTGFAAMSSSAYRLAATRFSRDVMGERLAALYSSVAVSASETASA
jgi:glycosyltransferase involved in cell wall biosynthesis